MKLLDQWQICFNFLRTFHSVFHSSSTNLLSLPFSTSSPTLILVIFCIILMTGVGFPHSSVGKESTCKAGDPSSTAGSGRSSGEGIGYHSSILGLPLWLRCKESACSVGDLDSNPGLGDPLKEKATHSSILAQRIPWTVQYMGSQRVGHD